MANRIYFDAAQLQRGDYYDIEERLVTEDGRAYELEEWVGRGGNAAVYRGREAATGLECAIKFQLNLGAKNNKRFFREIRLLRDLKNEHVAKYRGAGRVRALNRNRPSISFMIMDLAECNLLERLAAGGVSFEEYAGQFRGLASALAELHGTAVHRDIKPENILVAGDRWLLGDYGLCSRVALEDTDLTGEQNVVGPKYWLSPEAHNRRLGGSDEICRASDVFQLSAVFWFVVTGRHPCGVVTRADWSGPAKLFEPIYDGLMHDVTKRPQDGVGFFRAIASALEH